MELPGPASLALTFVLPLIILIQFGYALVVKRAMVWYLRMVKLSVRNVFRESTHYLAIAILVLIYAIPVQMIQCVLDVKLMLLFLTQLGCASVTLDLCLI
jgi:hypothetical protein